MKKELADGTIVDLTAEEEAWMIANSTKPSTLVTRITKLQCKRQAVVEGLWDSLKTTLAGDADMQEDWDLASELHIDDPSVIAMGTTMGKDADALQIFFNNAAKLTS